MKNKIPSFFNILQSLIKIPSVSSFDQTLDVSNKLIIDLLSNYFYELNFSIKVHKIPRTNNKFNMIASKESGSGGILLSGHIDTVPCDNNLWNQNPFSLIEKNNKYYGLGVVDMKGFFAFVLQTLKKINFKQLKKSIYILASADEETTMSGASYFIKNTNIQPDCIILGEPTSLVPIVCHKGYMSLSITVKGLSGHSSNPQLGINSIEIMHDILSQLIKLRNFFKENYICNGFDINYPTLNLGKIYGGNAFNRICSICTLHLDIRPTPNISIITINKLIQKKLCFIIKKWPNRIKIKNIHKPIPSYFCTKKNIIKKIENISNKHSTYANYCTEASFLQKIAPTIILGPGSINQAHQHNEYLDMWFINPTLNLLSKLINHFCF